MNKDISDKEAFAQKIADMEDSGLTHAQKNLVEHVEKAIDTHKGKEIDYHRYWKDMYEKEHKLRLEAEGETHLVKAVGMNSPEMKAANLKLEEMRKELDRVKLENNNLFTRVADSLEVNESHQRLNGKLQVRIAELEEDNQKLAGQVGDQVERARKAGL